MASACPRALGSIALLVALAICGEARAQLGATVGVVSDYRQRGVPLSDSRATASLDLSYDHPSGAYAGLSLVGESPKEGGLRLLGHSENLGYAARLPNGLTWDVGVSNEDFEVYGGRFDLSYTEVYAGVSGRGLSAHVHYSPNYLRDGVDTIYAELNGVTRPAPEWRLSAHAGALVRLDSRFPDGARVRHDVRVAATREIGRIEVEVGWTWVDPRPPRSPRPNGGFTLGATVSF